MNEKFIPIIAADFAEEEFKADFKRINKVIEKPLDELTASEVDNLIYWLERLAISFRNKLQRLALDDDFELFYKKQIKTSKKQLLEFASHNINVKIEKLSIEGTPVLHIHTPFLFRKSMKKSYYLSDYVNIKLHEILKNDKEFLSEFRCKLNLHIIRVDEKMSYHPHCDNDNLEVSEIINKLFYNIGISDNVSVMSFHSDVLLGEETMPNGIHFFLIPYNFGAVSSQDLMKLLS